MSGPQNAPRSISLIRLILTLLYPPNSLVLSKMTVCEVVDDFWYFSILHFMCSSMFGFGAPVVAHYDLAVDRLFRARTCLFCVSVLLFANGCRFSLGAVYMVGRWTCWLYGPEITHLPTHPNDCKARKAA